jgi:hypothetical protein
MKKAVVVAHEQLQVKVSQLKSEFPDVSFGYIGNCGVDRSGPFDDRSWYVFLPHPGRVGGITDRVGGFRTADLPKMLAEWPSIETNVRAAMKTR